MTSIGSIYYKREEQLEKYFPTYTDAIECEKRAQQGDDRAMRLLSVAFDARRSEYKSLFYKRYYASGLGYGSDHDEQKSVYMHIIASEGDRNYWHTKA